MKKYLAVVVCILMLMLAGCNVQPTTDKRDAFVSELYNKTATRTPIRIQFFLNGQNEVVTLKATVDYTDHKNVAALVLENVNRYISTEITCHDCKITNGIVMIDLSSNFSLLDDAEKSTVLASLASTFKQYGQEYIMVYSNGTAVSFNNATNVLLPPIRLVGDIYPEVIYQNVLNYLNMLNNNDDFVIPTVVWRNYDGVGIPCVENIPINYEFTASIIKYLFDDPNRSLVDREVLLEIPKLQNNMLIINAFNCSILNAGIIIKNMRQFCGDIDIEINNYEGPTKETAVFVDKTVINSDSNDYGDFAIIYYPLNDTIDSMESAVAIVNGNKYLSVAKYALENAILNCGGDVSGETLLYDVWFAERGVCVSMSNYCKFQIESLPPNKQKPILYSLVNTLCYNFNTTEVRILIDGYTVENIGDISTEFPLKATTK